MKVAVLCGHYPYSGAGVIAWESARALAARHEVTFVQCGGEEFDRRDGRFRWISLALPPEETRGASHLYWNPWAVRKLRGTLRSLAPDVVHFHIIQRRSFSLASLLLSRRHRTFWTIHDQWPLCVRSIPEPPSCEGMKRFCLFCTAWPGFAVLNKIAKESVFAAADLEVVVPSRWLGSLIRYSFLGRKQVHLIYSGIDLAEFHPAADAGAQPGGEGVTLLYVAGPNNATKGIAQLIHAFVRLKERHPSLRLRVVGDRPEGVEGVPGIEVVGRVPRGAMAAAYRRCDLFVLPTLADNTPVTLMEAMASGLPVVATGVGGIPEMVEPGVTGRLVPAGDEPALAAAIEGLAADPELRLRMGSAARRAAEARFSRERMVTELEQMYEAGREAEAGIETGEAHPALPGVRR